MYKITFKKSAVKEIRSLPKRVVNNIVQAIDRLSDDPRPTGCKKLKGKEQLWPIE